MAVPTVNDVLNRLEGVRQSGPGKWQALCPVHDDRNPSLSIAEGDGGKVLIYCHAGCDYADIMGKLGLYSNGNGRVDHSSVDKPAPRKKIRPPHPENL